MPPAAAIGAGIAGAASSAGGLLSGASGLASSLGGLSSSGSSSSGTESLMLQMQAAQLANEERMKISSEYFDDLIGRREIKRGKRKGEFTYGNVGKLLMGQKPSDVFGKKPLYRAVDFSPTLDQDPGLANVAGDVTAGNLRNFAQNAQLAEAVNSFLTTDSRNRVASFDPYLMGNIEATGRAAQLASQGIVPTSDAEGIIGNRNEMTSIYGTPGTSRGQVAKDLGLSQLDLQTRIAPQLTQTNAALINAIAPPQMRDDPRSREVQASQAIQVGAADNQFEAEFDRREQNLASLLAAIPDPRKQGIFNLQNTLRAQQFMIDFGLANGMGIPNTMPDNLGGDGMQGFLAAVGNAGSFFNSIGSLFGGNSNT